jgi:hypothetical protein
MRRARLREPSITREPAPGTSRWGAARRGAPRRLTRKRVARAFDVSVRTVARIRVRERARTHEPSLAELLEPFAGDFDPLAVAYRGGRPSRPPRRGRPTWMLAAERSGVVP